MESKRLSIPVQLEAFRRPNRWRSGMWLLTAGFVFIVLMWFVIRSPGESASPIATPISSSHMAEPPWRLGDSKGRFTLTLYADLECPYCRAYFPELKRWIADNKDVTLQWSHLPLAAHEPAASTEAHLVECVGQSGGHKAFWRAVEWVYAHTGSDGQGLPNGVRYPDLTPTIEQCLASEHPDAVIRVQAAEAIKRGVTATPSVRLHDRQTGETMLLRGPIEGDALLSAMDMLAAGELDATPDTEMPADVVGDMPR
jgi:hypothetical protein